MSLSTPSDATSGVAANAGGALSRRQLGVADIVFFIVAASAPLTVVAGGVSSTYLVTGNAGVPLLFLVLGGILALFVAGYAAMSHHITNAGAFYAYVSQGLGRVGGVATAFVALVSYNAMQIGISGLFGAVFAGFMLDKTGIDLSWWAWIFVAIALIGVLGWLRIDLNAKLLAIFLTTEIIVVAVFDLVVIGDPGPQGMSFQGFDPTIAFGAGLGAALVFSTAAFTGFESAAIYSEECKNPRKTVAKATYIALGITSLFYAFSALMLANAVGPDTATSAEALVQGGFTTPDGAAPDPTTILFIVLDGQISTFVADVAVLLFCTSLFAAMLSFHNAVARYGYALGRAKVLPSVFARVRPSTGSPFVGSAAQSVLAFVVVAIFALSGSDPILELFTWLTNLGALGVLALLALSSFAVIGYFAKRAHDEGAWATRIAPALAGVLLTIVFVLALFNFNVLITGAQDAPLDDRSVILPALLFIAAAVGAAVGFRMKKSRPDDYATIGAHYEERE